MAEKIKDQRHIEARRPDATRDDVKAAWPVIASEVLRVHGRFPRAQDDHTELVEGDIEARAYVNHGVWVADCPGEICNAGIVTWPGHDRAACYECGTIWPVSWPTDHLAGQNALVLRPEENRNWIPWEETVDDLKVENLLHGYAPGKKPEIAPWPPNMVILPDNPPVKIEVNEEEV